LFKLKLPLPLKNVYKLENKIDKEKEISSMERKAGEEEKISKSELEKIKKSFYQKGFEEGKKAGEASILAFKKIFKEAVCELKAEKKNFLKRSEKDLVEIALAIAKKIIKKEVDADPQIIRKIASEVLRRAVDSHSGKIVMRVNPKDWENLVRIGEGLFLSELSESEIRIEKDASIQSGGCIVETEKGLINASIESQLEEIGKALLGEEE